MKKSHRKISKKLGLMPGSVVHIGEERLETVRIDVIDYSETEHTAKSDISVDECAHYKDGATILWFNVNGVHTPELIESLGDGFGIHPLVPEDILNTRKRPKLEESDDYVLVVLKMLHGFTEASNLKSEQVSVLFGSKWAMTFQEIGEDVFEPVYNYSGDFPFLWDEIVIPVKYGSDLGAARDLISNAAQDLLGAYASQAKVAWEGLVNKYSIENAQVEPLVTIQADENWVSFTLRYVVEYRLRRTTKDKLFQRILSDIAKTGGLVQVASTSMDVTLVGTSQLPPEN